MYEFSIAAFLVFLASLTFAIPSLLLRRTEKEFDDLYIEAGKVATDILEYMSSGIESEINLQLLKKIYFKLGDYKRISLEKRLLLNKLVGELWLYLFILGLLTVAIQAIPTIDTVFIVFIILTSIIIFKIITSILSIHGLTTEILTYSILISILKSDKSTYVYYDKLDKKVKKFNEDNQRKILEEIDLLSDSIGSGFKSEYKKTTLIR